MIWDQGQVSEQKKITIVTKKYLKWVAFPQYEASIEASAK